MLVADATTTPGGEVAETPTADYSSTWLDDALDITLDADADADADADDTLTASCDAPEPDISDSDTGPVGNVDTVDAAAVRNAAGRLIDIELLLEDVDEDAEAGAEEDTEAGAGKDAESEAEKNATLTPASEKAVSEIQPEAVDLPEPVSTVPDSSPAERLPAVVDTQELISRYGSMPDVSQTRPQSFLGRIWHGIKSAFRRLFHRRRT